MSRKAPTTINAYGSSMLARSLDSLQGPIYYIARPPERTKRDDEVRRPIGAGRFSLSAF